MRSARNGYSPARIELDEVSFSYSKREHALRAVSTSFTTGITGLLGPNGAGKSTLLKLVSTAMTGAEGRLQVGGFDVSTTKGRNQARAILGYLPQQFELIGQMRVRETVAYAAWAQGIDESMCDAAAYDALKVVDLDDLVKQRVRKLSGGQRQRLGIAAAISHDPSILLLDEPTTGLDPRQRVQVRAHLKTIAACRTVVVATHLLEDVDRLNGRVTVLADGQIRFEGSTDDLRRIAPSHGSDLMSPLELAYTGLVENEQTAG